MTITTPPPKAPMSSQATLLKTTGEPLRERAFKWMLWFCLAVGLITLVVLLTYVVIKGWSRLDSRLITNMPSSVACPSTA